MRPSAGALTAHVCRSSCADSSSLSTASAHCVLSKTLNSSAAIESAMMPTMWYLTKEESQDWCEGRALRLDEAAHPVLNNRAHSDKTSHSEAHWSSLTWLSRFLASYLGPFAEGLL